MDDLDLGLEYARPAAFAARETPRVASRGAAAVRFALQALALVASAGALGALVALELNGRTSGESSDERAVLARVEVVAPAPVAPPAPVVVAPPAPPEPEVELVTVPTLDGIRLSLALRRARAVGLAVDARDGYGEPIPPSRARLYDVLVQETAAGSRVAPDSQVHLRALRRPIRSEWGGGY